MEMQSFLYLSLACSLCEHIVLRHKETTADLGDQSFLPRLLLEGLVDEDELLCLVA